MVVTNAQALGSWLWLSIVVPAGIAIWLLMRRLFKKFLEAFEKEAGLYAEAGGQHTAKKIFAALSRLCTLRFVSEYRKYLINKCRYYQTQGLKTYGSVVLELEKVFIPLRFSPESPKKIDADMLKNDKGNESFEIWNVLAKPNQSDCRCIAIIGPAGCGKSTVLQHLTWVYARRTQRRHHKRAPRLVPVLILLRYHYDYICAKPDLSLSDLIQISVSDDLKVPVNWFQKKLRKGTCIVMLDGLDEVANVYQSRYVRQWINQQMGHYPLARFILTSRPHGYSDDPLENINMVLAVKPFNIQEIGNFLERWYLQTEIGIRLGCDDPRVRGDAHNHAKDLKQRIINHSALAVMAVNPLLLTMIATVHRIGGSPLPERRVELFSEICNVFLGHRQLAKNLTNRLTAVQQRRVLQVLALTLMEKNTTSFKIFEGSSYIKDRLIRVAGPDENAEDFITDVEKISGLLVQRELSIYEFVHKNFQEYLASVEIKEANCGDYLLDKITNHWWEETIRLYAAQANDISKLLQAVLANPTIDGLVLADNCITEKAEVSPELRKAFSDIVDGLDSKESPTAELAAKVKLARRLRSFVRLDSNCYIDLEYVTCAEYQLFIDDQLRQNKQYQPDHWKEISFTKSLAASPVTGVRFSDAVEFCDWLTNQYPEVDIRYRLPTPDEVLSTPSSLENIGCWCEKSGQASIVGITPALSRRYAGIIKNALTTQLAYNLDRAIESILSKGSLNDESFDFMLACGFSSVGSFEVSRSFYTDMAYNFVCVLSTAINYNFEHDFKCEFDRALGQALDRTCIRDNISRYRNARTSDHNLAFGQNFNNLDHDIDFKEKIIDLASGKTQKLVSLTVYIFLTIINERRRGKLPAWEGIRIVKEKLSD